ncbi:ubiquitin-conjugating enzyme/RWD-like protein [Syncephalis fuscata]|nr:ubiquitin-conjugating enzyme/RWD-like protein [Syncephalis fuscata]
MSHSQPPRFLARIRAEMQRLHTDPPPGINCWPAEMSDGNGDCLNRYVAEIRGPPDSPYESGTFIVDLELSERYPMEPPIARFRTRVYHPNIDESGRICLSLLKMAPKGTWSPASNLSTLLMSIRLLLGDPNPDDPLLADIAREYIDHRAIYIQKASEFTSATIAQQCFIESPSTISIPVDSQTLTKTSNDTILDPLTNPTVNNSTCKSSSATFTCTATTNDKSNTTKVKSRLQLLKKRRISSETSSTPITNTSTSIQSTSMTAIEQSTKERQQLTQLLEQLHQSTNQLHSTILSTSTTLSALPTNTKCTDSSDITEKVSSTTKSKATRKSISTKKVSPFFPVQANKNSTTLTGTINDNTNNKDSDKDKQHVASSLTSSTSNTSMPIDRRGLLKLKRPSSLQQ